MRKLRRCVENNKRRQARARRTMMALMATSVAFTDAGALSVYAEGTPEVLQVTEVTNDVDEIEDENDIENEGNGEDGSGTDVENCEGDVDGEGDADGEDVEGDADGEDGEGDTDGEDSEDDKDDPADKDVKGIDKEIVRETRPLGSRMMLASSQNSSDTVKRISPVAGTTINLNDVEIENGRIEVVIENNGEYTLKGSNERNGAYVDVSIIIKGDVVADLNFDNFHIVNDDFEYTETTSITSSNDSIVNPIVVN